MSSRVVYYEPRYEPRPAAPLRATPTEASPTPFRCGEVGVVWLSDEGFLETDTRVMLGPNSYHSLVAHGVVEALGKLLLELGPLEPGSEAVLAPASMPAAIHLFYEADRETYGVSHDLLVARAWGSPPRDYRIAVDNREYQRTLSKLQFVASEAGRMGHGLRLRL